MRKNQFKSNQQPIKNNNTKKTEEKEKEKEKEPPKKNKNLINFAVFNEKIITEINLARIKPSEYAAKLERISTQVKDNKILVDDQEMILKEGIEIFDEAIQYLLNISPLEPFML